MKSRRLETIRAIISHQAVKSQDELQKLLEQHGFTVTQATLSRDLRELGIVKSHDIDRGGYCYVDPRTGKLPAVETHRGRFTADTIRSVEFSGHQGVIKTFPGFAAAVASLIDNNVHSGIMGTIAGDDAVLLILRENADAAALVSEISQYIAGFGGKVIDNS